jgi:hypothetical protein
VLLFLFVSLLVTQRGGTNPMAPHRGASRRHRWRDNPYRQI